MKDLLRASGLRKVGRVESRNACVLAFLDEELLRDCDRAVLFPRAGGGEQLYRQRWTDGGPGVGVSLEYL